MLEGLTERLLNATGGGFTVIPKVVVAPEYEAANVTAVADGGPGDARFTSIITVAGAPNCNAVATAAATTPNIRENLKWANFDVTR